MKDKDRAGGDAPATNSASPEPPVSVGRADFVARHGLWSHDQVLAADEVRKRIDAEGIEIVRFSFADQHGLLRGKALMADAVPGAFRNGINIVTTLLAKDTSHRTVYPVFTDGGGFGLEQMTGAGDFVMVPDPGTFHILPWAEKTGWMLCDIYFGDGTPVPFSTRRILQDAVAAMAAAGYDYTAGLEVEFHLFKLDDPRLAAADATQPATPPEVSLLAHGYNYLTESRFDELEPAFAVIRRGLMDLGLPLRSTEVEFGPSQCEVTFQPNGGVMAADTMMLFRSATKQIARRHGYLASFMCMPQLPNLFASGWHLHQSLVDRKSGTNALMPQSGAELLSPLGQEYVAGLIAHARAGAVFAAPTVNAYKRYKPNSLAPDRAAWGRDNRGVMLRALGGPGDGATRIENRAGEPAANPYLYMASQILAGLDGMARTLTPPPPTTTPYDTPDADALPRSLMEAVAALRVDPFYRAKLGDRFVDYYVHIKEAEIARFLSTVTDWEQAEYLEMF
jgi:glutamine synthetase